MHDLQTIHQLMATLMTNANVMLALVREAVRRMRSLHTLNVCLTVKDNPRDPCIATRVRTKEVYWLTCSRKTKEKE